MSNNIRRRLLQKHVTFPTYITPKAPQPNLGTRQNRQPVCAQTNYWPSENVIALLLIGVSSNMDAESKTSDADTPLSDPPTSDSDGSDSDTPTQETEWLATTRKRRSTAGNRMKSMLANEEPDSDLELLFAEDDDDQGFSDVGEEGSDVQMDSSSDDEDENNANADDMEGEKELERQARERRAAQRKRKAQEAIPAKFRKKVRINPTTTASAPAPAPRPKKKSERTSWLPSPADLPTRASSRKTTRISKEQLHQQMVEREAKRLKQLAQMEKKAARLEAMKKPPMTQEQRLAEAAIVEKRNSKSLNRWEEAEKQREEERKARLAALSQRTLKGPVITFWSGMGQWEELELRSLRPYVTEVEEKPKKKREKLDKGAAKGKVTNEKGQEDNGATKVGSSGQSKAVDYSDKTVTADADKDNVIPPELNKQEKEALVPSGDNGVSQPSDNVALPAKDKAFVAESTVLPRAPESESAKPGDTKPGAIGEGNADEVATVAAGEESRQTSKTSPKPTVQVLPKLEGEAVLGSTKAPPEPSPSPPTAELSTVSATQNAPSPRLPGGLAAPPPPPPATQAPCAQSGMSSRPSSVLVAPILERVSGTDATGSPPRDPHRSHVLAPPNTSQSSSSTSSVRPPQSIADGKPTSPAPPTPMDIDTNPALENTSPLPSANDGATAGKSGTAPESEVPTVTEPPRDMNATRNSIIFQNFDQHALRDKTIQTQILFGRKMTKLASKSPHGTSMPAHLNAASIRDTDTFEQSQCLHQSASSPTTQLDIETPTPAYRFTTYTHTERSSASTRAITAGVALWTPG